MAVQTGRYSFISEKVFDFNLQKDSGAARMGVRAPASVSGWDMDMSFNGCVTFTFIFNTLYMYLPPFFPRGCFHANYFHQGISRRCKGPHQPNRLYTHTVYEQDRRS